MNEEAVIAEVERLIREMKPEVAGFPIDSATTFKSDLGMDSLTQIELLWAVEDEFAVSVPEAIVPTLVRVGDVVGAVLAEAVASDA